MRVKVLHVAAEVFPLVKTGGLADVVARCRRRWPARAPMCGCCCPACRRSLDAVQHQRTVCRHRRLLRCAACRLLLGRMPGSACRCM
jgi:starch synthase